MNIINTPSANQGRELFYAIWHKVQERFYDQERLLSLNWADQKHRFDDQIVDEKSALRCATELLATIGDKYTRLLEVQEVAEKRERRVSETLHARNMRLHGNIGYIGIGSFDHSDIVEQVRERLEGIADCDAFVVDVRSNGGGLINETANVLELFIDEGDIAFTAMKTEAGLSETFVSFSHEHFVLYVEATGEEPHKDLCWRKQAMIAGKPMVVLMDEYTASSAEIFSAALLENGRENGRIIGMGAKTFGKGIGQADFEVMGTTVKISNMRFFSPSNKWFGDAAQTVANGVEPDIYMEDTEDPAFMVYKAADYLLAQMQRSSTDATRALVAA